MDIKKENVEYVARLARLKIDEKEKEVFTEQLSNILNYVNMLDELDTRDISPTFHVIPITNVSRPDETAEGLSREDALLNAPDQEGGFFKVPRVLGVEKEE